MPPRDPRYCVAQVTEEARDGWREFCERHGIDRNALGEVIGAWMVEHRGEPPPLLRQWVKDARDLANARKRRG